MLLVVFGVVDGVLAEEVLLGVVLLLALLVILALVELVDAPPVPLTMLGAVVASVLLVEPAEVEDEAAVVEADPDDEEEELEELEAAAFSHRYLQPMDNPERQRNTAACIALCMQRPAWRLSLQTHKITGIR